VLIEGERDGVELGNMDELGEALGLLLGYLLGGRE
jgi:hypothetical protein